MPSGRKKEESNSVGFSMTMSKQLRAEVDEYVNEKRVKTGAYHSRSACICELITYGLRFKKMVGSGEIPTTPTLGYR